MERPVEIDDMNDIIRVHDETEHSLEAAKQVVLMRGAG